MEPPHVRGGMVHHDSAGTPPRSGASMEPPHVRGGMALQPVQRSRTAQASMEPPHVRGGMDCERQFLVVLVQLQWSRRMFAAEWHNGIIEIDGTEGFNGAAACSRRNGGQRAVAGGAAQA